MKGLKRNIEIAATKHAWIIPCLRVSRASSFMKGALSEEARIYWQSKLLSGTMPYEQVKETVKNNPE